MVRHTLRDRPHSMFWTGHWVHGCVCMCKMTSLTDIYLDHTAIISGTIKKITNMQSMPLGTVWYLNVLDFFK